MSTETGNGEKPVIPALQKAQVFKTQGGPLLYKDIPVPAPGDNELLINVLYTGVCHLDFSAWRGDWPEVPTKANTEGGSLIGGHEGVGVVVAMGKDVRGWAVGDHAGVKFTSLACWQCAYCKLGEEPYCDSPSYSGYTIDGLFQQYTTVDAAGAPKIPKHVDMAAVAPILCAGSTVYKALKTTTAIAGDWVVISGCLGGLGSTAVQYAKVMGFRVIGIDTGDNRRKAGIDLGCEHFIDFNTDDVVAKVLELSGGGAKSVVNVSTSEEAIQQSLGMVKKRGVVVLVGLPAKASVNASVLATILGGIRIEGCFIGNRKDTDEAIEIFARGLIKLPITMMGLSELPKVYEKMEKHELVGRVVLDTSK